MHTTNESGISAAPIAAAKIGQAFERARQQGRGALIPYFMCGYPSAEQTVKLVLAAIEGGADIIELGLPFSDPLADGPTVQHAGHIALERGMTMRGCMEIAGQIAERTTTPLLFMGYYNPLLTYGLERFCADASRHGVSGLIIPDLPAEEAGPLLDAARQYGLSLVFLIPPTTPDERIQRIVEVASRQHHSFIYCVSLSGVTGARDHLQVYLRDFVTRVRSYTRDSGLPLAVGIGLSRPEHIAEVTTYADGAVVGSAIINLLDTLPEHERPEAVRHFIQRLIAG
ncbi:MAG: tryptophan synthase subunit alpha [Ktedonobacteraceae bacterium]|nr:tryptophan synthase subunit alpha [Ktedonobacteraceae bacterium]